MVQMPGFDGSGPVKEGPMTGWGRGFCIKVVDPDDKLFARRRAIAASGRGVGAGFGRGLRCFAVAGWGRGRGFGARFGRDFYEERNSEKSQDSE
jgi:hypothetical protein